MSFNAYAQKVRDPKRHIWMRWSNIHSCLRYVAKAEAFRSRREELFGAWNVGPDNPPTDEQLTTALNVIVAERNQYLEKLRVLERRQLREKMRSRRVPPIR